MNRDITTVVNTLVLGDGAAAILANENDLCICGVNFDSGDAKHPDIAFQQKLTHAKQKMNLDGFLFFEVEKNGDIHFTGRM